VVVLGRSVKAGDSRFKISLTDNFIYSRVDECIHYFKSCISPCVSAEKITAPNYLCYTWFVDYVY